MSATDALTPTEAGSAGMSALVHLSFQVTLQIT